MDAAHFLNTTDPLEAQVMQEVAERVVELRQQTDRNRAVLIANEVGRMLGAK